MPSVGRNSLPHKECYIEGTWYPSVTTVIASKPKPYIDAWQKKWGSLADRKMKLSGAIGTEFHACIERWMNDKSYYKVDEPMLDDGRRIPSTVGRIRGMFHAFMDWANGTDGELHQTELHLVSRRFGYSGTLDAVGTFKGEPMLYDYKSSSAIYPDMALQLAAYAQVYEEEYGVHIAKGMIVNVPKKRPFKVKTKVFDLTVDKFLEFNDLLTEFRKGPSDAKALID